MEATFNVVQCPQTFIEAFLSGSLSYNLKDKLTDLYNDYYKTALSVDQLKEVFACAITQAMDRIEILAPILNKIN